MRIVFATPGTRQVPTGNRRTTVRWARILRDLGHRVEVVDEWEGQDAELLLALHAFRKRKSVTAFRSAHPDRPIVVGLAGTDIYGGERVIAALGPVFEAADALVTLQPLAAAGMRPRERKKAVTIYQSVEPMRRRPRRKRTVDICMLANIRPVKDPLRAARAARGLPSDSRVRILHAGAALHAAAGRDARSEMKKNPRYRWLGPLTPGKARDLLLRSAALVVPSKTEGGANVVGEAIVAGVPVLASRVDGNVGLLGDDYDGYFEVGETRALRELFRDFEMEGNLRRALGRQLRERRSLFTPARERQAWKKLLGRFE